MKWNLLFFLFLGAVGYGGWWYFNHDGEGMPSLQKAPLKYEREAEVAEQSSAGKRIMTLRSRDGRTVEGEILYVFDSAVRFRRTSDGREFEVSFLDLTERTVNELKGESDAMLERYDRDLARLRRELQRSIDAARTAGNIRNPDEPIIQ
ncbi:MAG: hypothetical protein ACOCVG_04080, partial [Verrucomicrobiota bacterium]